MSKPASVGRRLLVSVALPLALFCILTVLLLDSIFRGLGEQALRDRLEEQLIGVLASADVSPEGRVELNLPDPESRLVTPDSGYYAWIRQRSGAELWRSPSAAGLGMNLTPTPVGSTAYRMRQLPNGGEIAVLSRGLSWEVAEGDNRDLEFSVAETTQPYQQQLGRFRRQMIGWFTLLALALLGTLAWRMRRALEPVRRLEREIGAVELGQQVQLSADYPRELEGVTRNLNALLKAERERIARYRDTLGNLAHSLKTPLAVIRATITHSAVDEQRRTIDAEVERMNQIVEHQLRRAVTGGSVTLGSQVVPVAPLLTQLRAALLKVHATRDLVIELQLQPAAGFSGDEGDLLELLGNLLDNACKWCRSRVRVTTVVQADAPLGERLCISVEDDGPGIASADRERVIERGVRADEHQPGHGLGLAMVRDTAALYGGRVVIGASSELGGAGVTLFLPGR